MCLEGEKNGWDAEAAMGAVLGPVVCSISKLAGNGSKPGTGIALDFALRCCFSLGGGVTGDSAKGRATLAIFGVTLPTSLLASSQMGNPEAVFAFLTGEGVCFCSLRVGRLGGVLGVLLRLGVAFVRVSRPGV